MSEHLPVLPLLLPLLGAALAGLSARAVTAARHHALFGLTLAVTASGFGIALLLLQQLHTSGPLQYATGGFPTDIRVRVDALSILVLLVVSGISTLVMAQASESLDSEIPGERHARFHCLFLLWLAGMQGVALAGDLVGLFAFVELASLSSCALIRMGPDDRSQQAAHRQLVLGSLGSGCLLLGIGLAFASTGTLDLSDALLRIQQAEHSLGSFAATTLLAMGSLLKAGVFPFHQGLTGACRYAPSVTSGLLAAATPTAALYLLLRILQNPAGSVLSFQELALGELLMPLALLAMCAASVFAIFQRNVKRMLAYSSIAQVGAVVLGISMASQAGLVASLVHLANHALVIALLYCALGGLQLRTGSTELDELRGIGRDMPLCVAAFVVGGLALIGTPLTAGFVSKWMLALAALEAGMWPVAAALLATSLLTLVCVARVVETAVFDAPAFGRGPVAEAPLRVLAPLWALAIATIYFGIHAEFSAGLAGEAAGALQSASAGTPSSVSALAFGARP